MTPSEMTRKDFVTHTFVDAHGNYIPHDVVYNRMMDWKLSCLGERKIKLVASESACNEFIRDLKGTIMARIFASDIEPICNQFISSETIASIMGITVYEANAWMWSCGIAREFDDWYVGNL